MIEFDSQPISIKVPWHELKPIRELRIDSLEQKSFITQKMALNHFTQQGSLSVKVGGSFVTHTLLLI